MELTEREKEYLLFWLDEALNTHDGYGETEEYKFCQNLIEKIKNS